MRGIITLCGSVRFRNLFERVATELTLWGYVVLMPNVWGQHTRLHSPEGKSDKLLLDKLHFDKIRLSDSIVVIDANGYIGESTRREIDFAKTNEKIVYNLQDYWILEKRGLPGAAVI